MTKALSGIILAGVMLVCMASVEAQLCDPMEIAPGGYDASGEPMTWEGLSATLTRAEQPF